MISYNESFSTHLQKQTFLSHNNPCFQYNIAITNFLVSYTREIRFHYVRGLSSVLRMTTPSSMAASRFKYNT